MSKQTRKLKVFGMLDAINRMPDFPGGYLRGHKGPKSQFIDHGKAVLRAMAKDLGLTEFKVWHNAGGDGVAGEVKLIGLWSEGNGIYVDIPGEGLMHNEFMYRHTRSMRDFVGQTNHWHPIEQLNYDWGAVLEVLQRLNTERIID